MSPRKSLFKTFATEPKPAKRRGAKRSITTTKQQRLAKVSDRLDDIFGDVSSLPADFFTWALDDAQLDWGYSPAFGIPPREAPPIDPATLLSLDDPAALVRAWSWKPFSELAQQLRSVEGEPVVAAPAKDPVHSYYGNWSYTQLDNQQLRWYFHWRSRVRAGEWPAASLPYILLHVYEAINGIEFTTERETLDFLMATWRRYQRELPWLQYHLRIWAEDYAVLHGMRGDVPEMRRTFAREWGSGQFPPDLIAAFESARFAEMPIRVVAVLAEYDPSTTQFYRQGHGELVDRAVLASLDAVDDALARKKQTRIMTRCLSRTESPVSRLPFWYAAYDGPRPLLSMPGARTFVPQQQRVELVRGIIKHADNSLREAMQLKTRVRAYEISNEHRLIVEETARRVLRETRADLIPETPAEAAARVATELVFDPSRLDALTSESNVVRGMLIDSVGYDDVPDEAGESIEVAVVAPDPVTLPDVDERDDWRAFVAGLDQLEAETIRRLANGALSTSQLAEIAASRGTMPRKIIDAINEKAIERTGDALVEEVGGYYRMFEDYAELVRGALSSRR